MENLATPWSLSVDEVLSHFGVDRRAGLSAAVAARRLAEHGPNELRAAKRRSRLLVFLSQFADLMVGLLAAAAVISALAGEWKDALLILTIVIVNAVIGYVHEERAENAVAQLKKLSQPSVHTWRDGKLEVVPAREVVPGDVLEIRAGGIVPADCRLIEAAELQVEESPLTGESLPVDKQTEPVAAAATVADRTSMLHAGTAVARGRAVAVVTSTGMGTELGQIADLLATASSGITPLGQKMNELSRTLAVVVTIVCAVVFVAGLLREHIGWQAMFLVAVSLAVAAIPEGLPAVITIALSLGSQRMATRRAIVRQLAAVETLGAVNVICSDKTGTLTQNRMVVADCLPAGDADGAEQAIFEAAVLCNDAQVSQSGEVVGSGTESALLSAAADRGWKPAVIREAWPRQQEFPFDSQRKRMSTVHRAPDGRLVAFVKGSAETVLRHSTQIVMADGVRPMTADERRRLAEQTEQMAAQGKRVLGVARRELPDGRVPASADEAEQDLAVLGFLGLADPIRPEVAAAIEACKSAGIRVAMLTGDHPETARSIAGELGILSRDEKTSADALVTGAELEALDDQQLAQRAPKIAVYARVSPAHKLRIVRALQAADQVVAMTGDGVNDAPALKQADIGIAMGVTGTDVSKEAARMVLADDNFATIVAAVEEGRVVYDNIRKFIRYLLASNLGEILLLFVAILLGVPVPLLPVQLLWINLVTDGLPAVALAFEQVERGTMARPPRRRTDSVFAGGLLRRILTTSAVMTVACLGVYVYFLGGVMHADALDDGTIRYARTAVFATAALFQLFLVMGLRHTQAPFWTHGLMSNYRLTLAVLAGFGLQLLIIYWPPLSALFHTTPLAFADLDIVLFASLTGLAAVEIEKLVTRRGLPSKARSLIRGR